MSIIISAFPGMGKTSIYKGNRISYSDSDSSKFSKKNFPDNYIKHIKRIRKKKDLIFVSSHICVRDALVKEKIPFIYVIPSLDRKEEFLNNYKERGNTQEFIENVEVNWERWLQISVYNNEYPVYVCVQGYLKDNLEKIKEEYVKFYLLKPLQVPYGKTVQDCISKSDNKIIKKYKGKDKGCEPEFE